MMDSTWTKIDFKRRKHPKTEEPILTVGKTSLQFNYSATRIMSDVGLSAGNKIDVFRNGCCFSIQNGDSLKLGQNKSADKNYRLQSNLLLAIFNSIGEKKYAVSAGIGCVYLTPITNKEQKKGEKTNVKSR